MSIKNDGHYFCRAGGNRPDGLNEPVTHKLKIRGLKSPADVLTFTGHEQLSSPFRYDIEFTSTNKAITPESVLMQDGAFSLTAPPVQGMPVQTALRTLHGVITSFKHWIGCYITQPR